MESLAKVKVGLVAPVGSKPQMMAASVLSPKVVSLISVVSRFSVQVSPTSTVSIPFVPPWIEMVSPLTSVLLPLSPVVLKIVPLRSLANNALLTKFVPFPRR